MKKLLHSIIFALTVVLVILIIEVIQFTLSYIAPMYVAQIISWIVAMMVLYLIVFKESK